MIILDNVIDCMLLYMPRSQKWRIQFCKNQAWNDYCNKLQKKERKKEIKHISMSFCHAAFFFKENKYMKEIKKNK